MSSTLYFCLQNTRLDSSQEVNNVFERQGWPRSDCCDEEEASLCGRFRAETGSVNTSTTDRLTRLLSMRNYSAKLHGIYQHVTSDTLACQTFVQVNSAKGHLELALWEATKQEALTLACAKIGPIVYKNGVVFVGAYISWITEKMAASVSSLR